MSTTITAVACELNGSTAISATNSTGQTSMECAFDDFSKLIVLGYNSDTSATTVAFNAGNSHFVRSGLTALSTSISSSAYVLFGPFDSQQYKSTDGKLIWSSSGSTGSSNVSWYAFNIPAGNAT